jgi:prepilin-type N-terminal cleavage/methylation domain-containing protein
MKGFTLIEMIVTVAISLVVTGFIIVNYNSYNDVQTLKQAALTLKNNLRFAQSKAATGEKPSPCSELLGYTVAFYNILNDLSYYTIRAECNPGGAQGATISINFPNGVTFSSPPSSFRFNVLSLGTTLNSDLTIQLAGSGKQYWIQVSPGGAMSDLGLH